MCRLSTSFVTLFFLVFLLAGTQRSRAQIGVAVGLNYESVSDLDVGNFTATYEAAGGYHAGLFYDLSLGSVGLRLGAFYRDLGDIESESDLNIAEEVENFDLTMLDFPVDIRLNLTTTPLIHPYLLFGPVFSVPSSGVDFIDKNLESLLVTGNIGIGLALNIAGISLFPEFRYAIGITRLLKDRIEIGGVEVKTEVQRVNSAMLRIGVIL
ncbi:MAG: hypothetical protein BMS9Abin05_1712 [Rhodothermia bacterium]|nr:MAG: hypothetical protein BMS9Abin05_1712 [Rhodothermia bacterium]